MRHALSPALATLLALAVPDAAAAAGADPALAAACATRPVLMEEFDAESIASRRIGPARWTAHTPWNGDFGSAAFADPGPGGPFKVSGGKLSITASKTPDGRWRSGLVAAADAAGQGVGTRYGYFEARMRMPPGPGTWPAFWLVPLVPASRTADKVELDVVEYYGHATDRYQVATHVWRADPSRNGGALTDVRVPDGSLTADFHTYGVDLSPQRVAFFLDGRQVWEQPTPPEMTEPMYPIVNLALGSGWPIDHTPNPSTLVVDYVHVFGRGPGPAEGCPPGPPRG